MISWAPGVRDNTSNNENKPAAINDAIESLSQDDVMGDWGVSKLILIYCSFLFLKTNTILP